MGARPFYLGDDPMKTVAILALVLAFLTAVLAVISGFGVRMEWWAYPFGFKLLRTAFVSGLVSGAVAIIASAVGLAKKIPVQRIALPALFVSILVVTIPYVTVGEFRKIRTYADATTNLEDPPAFVLLADARKTTVSNRPKFTAREAKAAQRKYFPDLQSITIPHPVAESSKKVREILLAMGLTIAPSSRSQERIEATDTSFWFGFKDDVVVVFKAMPDGSTKIDVRSASRVGKFDGGVNAKRVRAILTALKKAQ